MISCLKPRAFIALMPILLAASNANAEDQPDASAFCATDADRALVTAELAKGRGISLATLAQKSGRSPAQLAQALPSDRRAAVSPTHFQEVWNLMRGWRDPSFTVERLSVVSTISKSESELCASFSCF